MYGKEPYRGFEMDARKKILASFEAFCRRAPFRCKSFAYKRSEVMEPELFTARFKRDLVVFLTDNLEYFQAFDRVKIYYDNGQHSIAESLHLAIEYALSKDAVVYRSAQPSEYRLSQAANYICTTELTAIKYADHTATATDEKFFGKWSDFKKGILKETRKKLV